MAIIMPREVVWRLNAIMHVTCLVEPNPNLRSELIETQKSSDRFNSLFQDLLYLWARCWALWWVFHTANSSRRLELEILRSSWRTLGWGWWEWGRPKKRVQERTLEIPSDPEMRPGREAEVSQEGKQLDLKHLSNTVTEPQQWKNSKEYQTL